MLNVSLEMVKRNLKLFLFSEALEQEKEQHASNLLKKTVLFTFRLENCCERK